MSEATDAGQAPGDLTGVESHFRFGENWKDYSRLIDDARVAQAVVDLSRLVGDSLAGMTFLDIGSGSGLHSAAALALGASVTAVDLDPDSVATTTAVLTRLAPGGAWTAQRRSVFELPLVWTGRFDVVYSWGVLHHTGDMWRAIGEAADAVAPGGRLVLALYRRTLLCGAWRVEKRWYASAPPAVQARARRVFTRLFRLLHRVHGGDPDRYIREYAKVRGMDFEHDVHDWMGGYPYESTGPVALRQFLGARGFTEERAFLATGGRVSTGVLGSGCDEFLFRRVAAAESA